MGLVGVVFVAAPLRIRLPSMFIAPAQRLSPLPRRDGIHGSPCWGLTQPLAVPSCRLGKITSKCSAINTEVVDVNQIATEDGDSEDLLSVPIVHVNSETPESDSVNLLEETYLNTLLAEFPVLSQEEQDAISATPAHPIGLYALYANFLAGNFIEQLWNFAWPTAVALLHPSLLPVAVVGFFTKLTIFIGGPLIGNLIDSFPRVPSYNYLTIIQSTAQFVSATAIIYALQTASKSSTSSVLVRPWFIVLAIAAAIERLVGLTLGVMMERDWVVLLAGTNRTVALAQANATLSRVDLFCEIAASSLFGLLLTRYDTVVCLKLAAGSMVCALPVQIFLGQLTNKLSAGVLDRPKFSIDRTGPVSCSNRFMDSIENGVAAIRRGWAEYLHQPVLPASIAYVMLYFNLALAPGAMMTTYLTQKGISPSIIGGFSGLCAVMGVAATCISASLVKRLGVLKAGAAGLVFQALLLTTAVAVLWSGLLSNQTPLFVFLFLVVLSRLGHISYDVVGTQILQTGIPTNKANLIGATEVSMASLAEFAMLGIAIVANDVSHFGFLAVLSVFSVVGAAWVFCTWLSNPTEKQRKLFSYDPHFQLQL